MEEHKVVRFAARAAAGIPVTLAAVAFTFAGGGAVATWHSPVYSQPAPYALTAVGHEDDAHVDLAYEFIHVPVAETGGTAATFRWHVRPEV